MNNPTSSNRMQYAIWMGVAALVIIVGFGFSWLTIRSFHAQIRQSLREQKQSGRLPVEWQGIDPDTVDISKLDLQMKLPSGTETRLQIAFSLTNLWYVWVPLVVAMCFVMAMIIRRRSVESP